MEPLRWSGLESELAADAFQRRGFGGAISSAALLLGPRAIGPAQSALHNRPRAIGRAFAVGPFGWVGVAFSRSRAVVIPARHERSRHATVR